MTKHDPTDVVVAGAGIVGLFNALQLAKRDLRVVLVDNVHQKRSYKVGESLLVFSNELLRSIGETDEFLNGCFRKHGIWFCYGLENAHSFEAAREYAFDSEIPDRWVDAIPNKAFVRTLYRDVQLVRPELEDRMRDVVYRNPNITFIDDAKVTDLALGKGDAQHRVDWQSIRSADAGSVRTRWFVDCSGRRRLLAKKLGHAIEIDDGFQTTAVWGQFGGIDDEVFDECWQYAFPDGSTTRRDRYTCHLWGDGYWVWVIRLAGDRLSLGVSFDQRKSPSGADFRAQFWNVIHRYPLLQDKVSLTNLLEMRTFQKAQHLTDTHVSPRRYAMAGDAASIIDAYYSQGISLALAASWHIANIMAQDVHEHVLDEAYIAHTNRALRADWRMMRAMVQGKYSGAVADSRYFVLSHVLDFTVFGAALLGRYQLARWLTETEGYLGRETAVHRRLRALLSKRLFLSQAFPFNYLSPETVAKAFHRLHDGLTRRALWRLEHRVAVGGVKCITRTVAAIPAVWRLPFVPRDRVTDISGKEIVEPRWMRITGKELRPPAYVASGPFMVLLFMLGYVFDWGSTLWRRVLLRLTPSAGGRRSKASGSVGEDHEADRVADVPYETQYDCTRDRNAVAAARDGTGIPTSS